MNSLLFQVAGYSNSSDLSLGILLVEFALGLVMMISYWAVYVKAGRSGWECLIPFYNAYVLADIATDNALLWTILSFIPGVNIVAYCVVMYKLAKAFDESTVFALLLIFIPIIGLPVLAFGSAQYGNSYF